MVYKAMSHVTLPRMRELSPAPTLIAKIKRRLLYEFQFSAIVKIHIVVFWIMTSCCLVPGY
jgi:hypothetical protein